ncbi:hypothetical protein B566_EDAN007096 [Ephemera danica]|nr:hypothetical protein B566_EDAN007096 [Ephemera danica]
MLLAFVLQCESLRVAPEVEDVEEDDGAPAEDEEETTTVKPSPKPAAVLTARKTQPVISSSKNTGILGNIENVMKNKDELVLTILRKPLPNIIPPVLRIHKNAASERSGKMEEQEATSSTPSPTSTPSSLNLTRFPTGAYYFQKSLRLNWFDAGDWCRRRGMDLATVTTQEENTYIVDKLLSIYAEAKEPKSSNAFFWFGLNSLATQKSFTWIANGEELGNFRFWGPKQPDFGSELCGEYMYRDAEKPMWNDRSCTTRGRFICEARAEASCKSSAK